jgi:N-acetylglucosaminyl-diphospho-decaprenol L-rhamnosyltransferase
VPKSEHADVDVVVVAYNSSSTLRDCVTPLAAITSLRVIVVDNASDDGSAESVRDLGVDVIEAGENRGFAAGCNLGAAAGTSPYVLFLNPDARIDLESIQVLTAEVEDSVVGAAAPRILSANGHLEYSQRRFPSVASTFAQGLFLHRMLPRADWTDEVIRDESLYEVAQSPDWVSGACLLVKRSVFEQIGGWDESFFLYSEDTDLCRRIRSAGYEVRFLPAATAVHIGGQSSPRSGLLPLLATSRARYAAKHSGAVKARLIRGGIAVSALTHMLVARRKDVRDGHAKALRAALKG